jgi:hypothetical protein
MRRLETRLHGTAEGGVNLGAGINDGETRASQWRLISKFLSMQSLLGREMQKFEGFGFSNSCGSVWSLE